MKLLRLIGTMTLCSGGFAEAVEVKINAVCKTDSCSSIESCSPESENNIRSIACFSYVANKTCPQAVSQAKTNGAATGIAIGRTEELLIKKWFDENAAPASRCGEQDDYGAPTANCPDDSDATKPPCSKIETRADADRFAAVMHSRRTRCAQALDAMKKVLDSKMTRIALKEYYFYVDNNDTSCAPPLSILEGPLNASLYRSDPELVWGGTLRIQHAIQFLPSFSIGIPFALTGPTNEARQVLNAAGAGAGLYVRYSPIALLISIHGFIGTVAINGASLDETVFPSPAMMLEGIGIDFLNGAVGLSYVWGQLRDKGLFGQEKSTTQFFQVSIDLTGIVISVAGGLHSTGT